MIFGNLLPGPGRLHVARFGDPLEFIGFIKVPQHFVGRPAALPFGLLFAVKCLGSRTSCHVLKNNEYILHFSVLITNFFVLFAAPMEINPSTKHRVIVNFGNPNNSGEYILVIIGIIATPIN